MLGLVRELPADHDPRVQLEDVIHVVLSDFAWAYDSTDDADGKAELVASQNAMQVLWDIIKGAVKRGRLTDEQSKALLDAMQVANFASTTAIREFEGWCGE